MRPVFLHAYLLFGLLVIGVCHAEPGPAPTDGEIKQILMDRIDVQKESVGIVVGIIEPKGRRIVSYGQRDYDDKRPLDGDTVFEIGSITKVFTALVAADMAQRREINLDDPVVGYLRAGRKLPERNSQQITFVDLATHTSGLPRMPTNFHPRDPTNPFADYSAEQLYEFLSKYELPRDIGVQWEYSNVGFGLLGEVLAQRSELNYETLVETRICEPLKMASTRVTLSPQMIQRLSPGHNADLSTVHGWDFLAMQGTGALRSSANDLLTFLAANLSYADTPLSAAMRSMLTIHRSKDSPSKVMGLGWGIDTSGTEEIIWKNGGTGGYRTFIGFVPRTGRGVVVLSNTITHAGIDDIGMHLLDGRHSLLAAKEFPNEGFVEPKRLQNYVGRYRLSPSADYVITREGGRLYGQTADQGRFALYPINSREFFAKLVEVQLTFEVDSSGRVDALTLRQNGHDQRAKRVSDAD